MALAAAFAGLSLRCKAPGCTENHLRHHCIFCGNDDADHRSNECSKRHEAVVFHGTTFEYAQLIKKNGWKESTRGALGPGVYFTSNEEAVKKIAQRHGTKAAVIKCRVDLGKLKCNYGPDQTDIDGKWRRDFDSIYRRCDPWVTMSKFREFAVKKEKIVEILEVKEV